MKRLKQYDRARVAQEIERSATNREVGGAIPPTGTESKEILDELTRLWEDEYQKREDMFTSEALKGMHTRQLLAALKEKRAAQSLDESDQHLSWRDKFLRQQKRDVQIDMIKAELATREHVPSKPEAHQARQEQALRARGKGKGKNR